jgi:hypothetical protein
VIAAVNAFVLMSLLTIAPEAWSDPSSAVVRQSVEYESRSAAGNPRNAVF